MLYLHSFGDALCYNTDVVWAFRRRRGRSLKAASSLAVQLDCRFMKVQLHILLYVPRSGVISLFTKEEEQVTFNTSLFITHHCWQPVFLIWCILIIFYLYSFQPTTEKLTIAIIVPLIAETQKECFKNGGNHHRWTTEPARELLQPWESAVRATGRCPACVQASTLKTELWSESSAGMSPDEDKVGRHADCGDNCLRNTWRCVRVKLGIIQISLCFSISNATNISPFPSAVPGRWRRPGWTRRHTAGCSARCRSPREWPASTSLWVCGGFPDAGCCSKLSHCNLRGENEDFYIWWIILRLHLL